MRIYLFFFFFEKKNENILYHITWDKIPIIKNERWDFIEIEAPLALESLRCCWVRGWWVCFPTHNKNQRATNKTIIKGKGKKLETILTKVLFSLFHSHFLSLPLSPSSSIIIITEFLDFYFFVWISSIASGLGWWFHSLILVLWAFL